MSPDAELLRLCAKYQKLEADYRRSCEPDDSDLSIPPGYNETLRAITRTRAWTLEGQQAKALAALAHHDPASEQDTPDLPLVWGLIRDVAGQSRKQDASGLASASPPVSLAQIAATEHAYNLHGLVPLLRDTTDLIQAAYERGKPIDPGDASDWVVRLDTLGNLLCEQSDTLNDRLREAKIDAPLSWGLLIRRPA